MPSSSSSAAILPQQAQPGLHGVDPYHLLAQRARLAGSSPLAEAASELAAVTLRVQMDLFRRRPAPAADERARFAALVLELLPRADETAAREIASQVACLGDPPTEVVEALFARGGETAAILIGRLARLGTSQRAAALSGHDPRLAAALALRADLTAEEQQRLAARGEPAILTALARNHKAPLSARTRGHAVAAAVEHPELREALLARNDLDALELAPLYGELAPAQRAAMRAAVTRRLAASGRTLRVAARPSVSEELLAAALAGPAELLPRLIVNLGAGEAAPDFDPARLTRLLLNDPGRDGLAIALTALGVPAETATRILLRLGDEVARDARQIMGLVEIMRALPSATAGALLAAICPPRPIVRAAPIARPEMALPAIALPESEAPRDEAAKPARTPRHVPVMAEGGARLRPGSATPAQAPARRPAASPARRARPGEG